MSCMKAVEYPSDSQMHVGFLAQTAFNKLDSGNAMHLVDDRLVKAEDGGGLLSGFENIIRIGLWCAQEDPLQRPTMSVVVKMLEGAMDVLAFPQLERPAAQDSSLLLIERQFTYIFRILNEKPGGLEAEDLEEFSKWLKNHQEKRQDLINK
ncbi:hypothetical protein SELMODRAFT_413343 [Selaginella moellendorffii]|uniref:Serine-threonine/tyrosine-protein kinase catalytic domain-containing protein n=1 Tax=Selaginella moellendorffii TaxID=88036 RepID=D8RP58_SELML|nr:hypothetical protein SELMODRAFT_413343 [Selaginella moellendorffii]